MSYTTTPMMDLCSKCQIAVATYGSPGASRSHCLKCKTDDMIFIKIKYKCRCGKSSRTFGFFGERPICCQECKENNMINLIRPWCSCGNPANYANPGTIRASHCKDCKTDDMVKIEPNRTTSCSCGLTTSPIFGLPSSEKPTHCSKCKTEEMVDLKHLTCPCGARATFLDHSGKLAYCGSCKSDGMKSASSVYCQCGVEAGYGFLNGKLETCVKHKSDGMILLKGKRCITAHCETIVCSDSRYKPYCFRCFVYLFPDQQISRNYKVKETHLADFVKAHLQDTEHAVNVTYDRKVSGECSSGRRPDIMVDLLTHVIIIECDEDQHSSSKYCSCENKRMMQIFADVANRLSIFIRFNPDGYRAHDNTKIPSCFTMHKSFDVPVLDVKEWKRRTSILADRIDFHSKNIPSAEVTIENLFYDGFV